jgi:hypothetical protein
MGEPYKYNNTCPVCGAGLVIGIINLSARSIEFDRYGRFEVPAHSDLNVGEVSVVCTECGIQCGLSEVARATEFNFVRDIDKTGGKVCD